MNEIVLYVRSKEVSSGTSPGFSSVHGHVTVHSGSLRTTRSYGPEAQEATNLSEENRIACTLVDLTESAFCGAVIGEIGWSEDAYDDVEREEDGWHRKN